MRKLWRHHGLSLTLAALFVVTFAGQVFTGWYAFNDEQREHREQPVSLPAYLRTGHFGEATFENFESEFLQMACYVLLTASLYQVGSSESKRPGKTEAVDRDPRRSKHPERAPWPVRRGGFVLTLYENSLSLTFGTLFVASFALHAVSGKVDFNDDRATHGEALVTLARYFASSRFWFESLQNWQSEFLSLAAMVTLTIFLRQRGSPESKPVDAPNWETGE